jgi:hypothetical protein
MRPDGEAVTRFNAGSWLFFFGDDLNFPGVFD